MFTKRERKYAHTKNKKMLMTAMTIMFRKNCAVTIKNHRTGKLPTKTLKKEKGRREKPPTVFVAKKERNTAQIDLENFFDKSIKETENVRILTDWNDWDYHDGWI